MLYLVQSNQLESLFTELCARRKVPPDDILAPEEIVVQNTGMATWLARRIALQTGIAANIRFPLPARFFGQLFAGLLAAPEAAGQGFDRPVLLWRIMELLPVLSAQREFADIGRYLIDDGDGLRAYHLAGVVVDLFDRYLVFRPDMLLAWEDGAQDAWQAELWRRLQQEQVHRAGLLRQVRQKFEEGAVPAASLPPRIILFGISSLAPAYLEIVDLLGRLTDVHLLHLNPCRQYWADLSSDARMARERAGWRRRGERDLSDYFDRGNPLLASLGKVGQEFFRLLAEMEFTEVERYVKPRGGSLLANLQGDILDLRDRTDPAAAKISVAADDRSVQFHICHSRLREVQVLHDRLLEVFEADPSLQPGEVLVMAPDIEAYAPSVWAVFDSGGRDSRLPWSLADRTPARQYPLADTFLELLELPGSRCTVPEVLALLEATAVQRRFGIDDRGLAVIRRWIHKSGIRWGFDRAHRREHGLDMSALHSWSFGMDRLFLGYFSGENGSLFKGISPCGPMSAEGGELLGRLAHLLDRLRQYSELLRGERTPEEWGLLLLQLLDDFFDPGSSEEDEQSLLQLREGIGTLMQNCRAAGFRGRLSSAVVREYCRQALSIPVGGQGFLSGRVTFCNMVPLRSIPFKVICLLGMNDGEYPRSQYAVSFDIMAAKPRIGDRDRRSDDRYLFLEALISARKILYISWQGRDQQDNSHRPPSGVVAELLDYLERAVSAEGTGGRSLLVEHPLQPFSRRCYDGSSANRSYAAAWYPGSGQAGASTFVADPLAEPADEARSIDLGQLTAFWSNPVRFFLQQRLDMRLREEDDVLPENEPFQPEPLERYRLVGSLLHDRLAGTPEDECCRRLSAAGELPHGEFGTAACRQMLAAANDLAAKTASLLASPRQPLEVELFAGDHLVTGWLEGVYETGCVRCRPALLKGRDLLRLWLEHLVLNILAPSDCMLTSYHAAADTVACFRPVAEPRPILTRLVDLYLQGLCEPLHFFPESALAWYEAEQSGSDGMQQAWKCWQPGYNRSGEGEDTAYLIGLRGRQPLDIRFAELAAAVYGPLFRSLEK
jgi:exodeoxyribonuclease V gamma subunit